MSCHDSRTFAQYAAELASSAPTPGGGSAAASAGALAAALAEMVANVTLAGKNAPAAPDALRAISESGEQLRGRFFELAHEDELAYGSYRDAAALPRSTEEEKAARRGALDAALLESANVPMEIARTGVTLLDLLLSGGRHATKHLLSDVSTGAVLAEAAIRGALFTAGINADLMRNPEQQSSYRAEIDSLLQKTKAGVASIMTTVAER
jgi:formiminotetrahydrofolate cyclodeaminase